MGFRKLKEPVLKNWADPGHIGWTDRKTDKA